MGPDSCCDQLLPDLSCTIQTASFLNVKGQIDFTGQGLLESHNLGIHNKNGNNTNYRRGTLCSKIRIFHYGKICLQGFLKRASNRLYCQMSAHNCNYFRKNRNFLSPWYNSWVITSQKPRALKIYMPMVTSPPCSLVPHAIFLPIYVTSKWWLNLQFAGASLDTYIQKWDYCNDSICEVALVGYSIFSLSIPLEHTRNPN